MAATVAPMTDQATPAKVRFPDGLGGVFEYATGHRCEPNGVGDYRFLCPKHGEKPGFIPFYLAPLVSGSCKCGEQIVLVGPAVNGLPDA